MMISNQLIIRKKPNNTYTHSIKVTFPPFKDVIRPELDSLFRAKYLSRLAIMRDVDLLAISAVLFLR